MSSLIKTSTVVAALMVMFCVNSAAQTSIPICEYSNRFFFEMGSASNLFGLGYERQLIKHQKLLLRTGVSYISFRDHLERNYYYDYYPGDRDDGHEIHISDNYFSVPLGITYLLLPEHRAHVEFGLGVVGSLQFVDEQNMQEIVTLAENGSTFPLTDFGKYNHAYKKLDKERKTLLKGYSYFNVGYRFEAHNGFMVRAGFALIHYFDPRSRYFGDMMEYVDHWNYPYPTHSEPGTYDFTIQHHRRDYDNPDHYGMSLYFGIGFAF